MRKLGCRWSVRGGRKGDWECLVRMLTRGSVGWGVGGGLVGSCGGVYLLVVGA